MKIIGIGYKKETGKNTFSKFMVTYLRTEYPGLKIREVSFAAKLKDISHQIYKWAGLKPGIYYESHRDQKEIKLKELNLSPREIWIQVGNKIREVYPTTWIDYALNGVEADILIVTDLRFQNEARAIREAGGILIKLVRDSVEKGNDPAEVDLDNWEDWYMIMDNNGTLQELNTEAERLVRILL